MDDKTRRELDDLIERIRERNATNEGEIYEFMRRHFDMKLDESYYYPFQALWGFMRGRFWRTGFIYMLIVVAVIAIFFALFSDVPTETP